MAIWRLDTSHSLYYGTDVNHSTYTGKIEEREGGGREAGGISFLYPIHANGEGGGGLHLYLHTEEVAVPELFLFVYSFLGASCLFREWLWHSHGIWCLCDCIKPTCGLLRRRTGTNLCCSFVPDCAVPRSFCIPSKSFFQIELPASCWHGLLPSPPLFGNTLTHKCQMVYCRSCFLFCCHSANTWQETSIVQKTLYSQAFSPVIIVCVGCIQGDLCIYEGAYYSFCRVVFVFSSEGQVTDSQANAND